MTHQLATALAAALLGAPIVAMLLVASKAVTTAGPLLPLLLVTVVAGIWLFAAETSTRTP